MLMSALETGFHVGVGGRNADWINSFKNPPHSVEALTVCDGGISTGGSVLAWTVGEADEVRIGLKVGFLKIISVGIPTYAAMKTSF